ncbi:MAG: hypothetical protein NC311_06680 [Muribaculaceae bacterium]|nr:hypothetical protein [Muribaculaceae bacterium]
MKITANANLKVLNAMVDTTADTINEFSSDRITITDRDEALRKCRNSSRKHEGAGWNWKYTVENETGTLEFEMEDDAVLMFLPVAVKIAKVLSPFYDMAKAAVKMAKNVQGQFTAIGNEFSSKYNEKFGRTKKYAVVSLWEDSLEMADVVVVEDNGFGEHRFIRAEHCWSVNKVETIMKVFERKLQVYLKAAEEMKNESSFEANYKAGRYDVQKIEFEEITKDEALARAQSYRKGLQADVDGMKEGGKI